MLDLNRGFDEKIEVRKKAIDVKYSKRKRETQMPFSVPFPIEYSNSRCIQ